MNLEDERMRFETYVKNHYEENNVIEKTNNGVYKYKAIQDQWLGWFARAARYG